MQNSPDSSPPVVIKHPEAGLIDCVAPPPVCNGPCCGTCDPTALGLRKAGVRLNMMNEWVSEEHYYFQFAMSRKHIAEGTPTKCVAALLFLRPKS